MKVKEHKSLDGNYKDLVRTLYRHEPTVRMVTGSCGRNEDCSGGSTIRVEVSERIFSNNIKSNYNFNEISVQTSKTE